MLPFPQQLEISRPWSKRLSHLQKGVNVFSNSFHELWYESKQRKLMSILCCLATDVDTENNHYRPQSVYPLHMRTVHRGWVLLPTAAFLSECVRKHRIHAEFFLPPRGHFVVALSYPGCFRPGMWPVGSALHGLCSRSAQVPRSTWHLGRFPSQGLNVCSLHWQADS